MPEIKSFSCGLRHSVCVDTDGHAYTWGAGSKYQLGHGEKINKTYNACQIKSIENADKAFCGQFFTLIHKVNGEVLGFGDNKFMQLKPDRNILSVKEPQVIDTFYDGEISCGWTHVIYNNEDNILVMGRNNYYQHGAVDKNDGQHLHDMPGVREVLAGSEHCMCLTQEGHVVSWGWNEHGNCGLGDTGQDNVMVPTKLPLENVTQIFVGSAHCFAVTK